MHKTTELRIEEEFIERSYNLQLPNFSGHL